MCFSVLGHGSVAVGAPPLHPPLTWCPGSNAHTLTAGMEARLGGNNPITQRQEAILYGLITRRGLCHSMSKGRIAP